MTATAPADAPDQPELEEAPTASEHTPAVVEVLPPDHPAAALPAVPTALVPQQIVGLPAVAELHTMEMVATQISATEMVPKAYRNKPDAILACWLAGRELRIPPMQSLRDIDIVEGKPAPSAKLVRELIQRAGHSIRRVTELNDKTKATYKYRRREWPAGEWETATYTIEMAIEAELVRRTDDGKLVATDSQGRAKPWQKFTANMLRHRCLTTIGREEFSDCLGVMIYTAEELGADVDEDGRLLDSPATDPRSPAHTRWDLAREALEAEGHDDAIEWLDAQLNERGRGRPMAYLTVDDQETWAQLAEHVLARKRGAARTEAAGDVDPAQPHRYVADALGACTVCGGNKADQLHADPTLEPDAGPPAGEERSAAAGEDPASSSSPAATTTTAPPDEPPLGNEIPPRGMVVTFHQLVREVGWPDDVYRAWLRREWQVSSSKDLGARDMAEAIDQLRDAAAQPVTPDENSPEASATQGTPPRSEAPAMGGTTPTDSAPDTAPESVSAGQTDTREDLMVRYSEAMARCEANERAKGRVDAKRAMTLPGGDIGAWDATDVDELTALVEHAERVATELDPSRPLPAPNLPY